MIHAFAPGPIARRWLFALFGAVSAYAIWMLVLMDGPEMTPFRQRSVLAGLALIAVFIGGFFAMAGRLGILRAALRAALLAVAVAALVVLLSLRWPDLGGMFDEPTHLLPMLAIAVLPVPFLIAGGQGSWRDYPALFDISWEIVARGMVAVFFTGAVWTVILLSMQLLDIVGVNLIDRILDIDGAPLVISGAAFGLAVAVVNEMAAWLSPRLIHWLLRLLLPPLALVSAIFVVAVVMRGFGVNLAGISPALVLLAIAASGIALVTVGFDADARDASKSPLIFYSAGVMTGLLPVLAALSLRAVWIRITEHGLTPNRLLVVVLGLIALVYGLTWGVALLRRRFAAGVRASNPWLAIGVLFCAAIWHTPLFNAEALSARDQERRVMDGRRPAAEAGWQLFAGLGHAGEAARLRLMDYAVTAGNQDLADRLVPGTSYRDQGADEEARRLADLRRVLGTTLDVVPASAGGSRLMYLEGMSGWEIDDLNASCQRRLPTGERGCLLLVSDLLPDQPGEEAVLLQLRAGDWAQANGIWLDASGRVASRELRRVDGNPLSFDEVTGLLRSWREAPPALAPARLNQLGSGSDGLLFVP
ncbi:DUF4153 domain-containing protein [Pseudogemmobacter bohemicus]|uniref:DUF4153 domain-containing protein n=1 Tax=Pseudogemmobacter bohemicus TaxID=2250708 RepID=UPI000DD401A9|nr:DUF4153 domain-containing protein [Pseudogemmobacter bohemicus]